MISSSIPETPQKITSDFDQTVLTVPTLPADVVRLGERLGVDLFPLALSQPGYCHWLAQQSTDEALTQLHAWQGIARKRLLRGAPAGDLEATLALDLPPVSAPTPEPSDNADPHYRTSLEIAITLPPNVSEALDHWKAAVRRVGGGGNVLRANAFCEMLIARGWSESRAKRTIKAGVGTGWRRTVNGREVYYVMMSDAAILAALGLSTAGKWVRLPQDAYTGGHYHAHVIAAWIEAHPDYSRATQSRELHLTKRHLRRVQRQAGLKQRACFADVATPRTLDQVTEADHLMQDRENGGEVFQWTTKGTHTRQIANHYYDGPARQLGPKRTKRIKDELKRLVTVGSEATLDFPDTVRRFDTPQAARRWQKRNPDQGVLVLKQDRSPALRFAYAYSGGGY